MSNAETTEPKPETTTNGRGPRSETQYPYYGLGKAIEIIAAIRKAGGNEAPNADVMRELNVTVKTDRLWAYGIPAAGYFGLIERIGRGDDGRIKLTELALRIALPATPEEARAAKIEACKTPELYARLLEKFAGHPVPSKDGLKNILHRDYKIVESMAPNAADAFIESLKTAELVNANNAIITDAPVQDAQKPSDKAAIPVDRGAHAQSIDVPADHIAHVFQLRKNLNVTLPLPSDLTSRDVERLHKWLQTLPLEDVV